MLPGLCILLSCLQGEDAWEDYQQRLKDWFQYADNRVAPIAETMRRVEMEKPFMEAFCQQYGIPLWDYADVYQALDDETVYFWVPLYNSDYPNEIRSIWYFEMKDGLLDYGPITRDAPLITQYGQDFQFDYLSYLVFGRQNASGLEFRDPVATRYYEVIGVECRDAYTIVGDLVAYKGTVCKEVTVWREEWDSDLVDGDDGNVSPGGGSGTGVPVEGSGGNADKAKKMFENKNMTDRNWEIIEKMIDKIDENCMGNALHKALEDALGDDKLHIEFIAGRSSLFSSHDKLTISLGMDYAQSNALLHEMFHALQYFTKGKDSYNKSELNCEIEAYYAQYLYLKSLPEFKGSYWEDMYEYDARMKSIAGFEKYLDESAKTTDSKKLNRHLETVVDAFREAEDYSESLQYSYDPNQGGILIFSLLQNLIKDCN